MRPPLSPASTTVATALWVVLLCAPAAAASAELVAERIDADNFAQLQPGGPDAIGGIGDWAISNGTLCAVVTDPAHEGYVLATGGSLVDLGFCGRGDDQFVVLEPLANLAREDPPRWEQVTAAVVDGEARIDVRGERDGVRMHTRYAVDGEDRRRIRVTTRLERVREGGRLFAFGDVTIHNDGVLRPFTLARSGPSEGFRHGATGDATVRELLGSIVPVRSVVLVGPEAAARPISYGLRVIDAHLERATGEHVPVPFFGLSTETVTSIAAFVRPFWIGSEDALGLIQLGQSLFMDLASGDALVFEREVRVADHTAVAPFTDLLHPQAPLLRGRVSDAGARLHVRHRDGSAVSEQRPRADGSFALRLPPGSYALELRAPGGRRLSREFEQTDAGSDLGLLALPEAAWVEIPASLAPARLAFRGTGETADPIFGDDELGFEIAGAALPALTAASDLHLGGIASDPARAPIAPGTYRVYATRGLEFGVTLERFVVAAGETHRLRLEAPQRALETPGWIAADLHVHAAASDDSTVPLERRVASFLAEGGEILVATDHDHVTDYGPVIRRLGLADRLRSIVGLEVTSVVSTLEAPGTAGHSNVFPLPYRPQLPRKGAIASEGRRLRDIIADARGLPGTRLVQLNHGRENATGVIASEGAFLTHLSIGRNFEAREPLESESNRSLLETSPRSGLRDLDFDAMELLNGPSIGRYEMLRNDWVALLRQGYPKIATANSDTHTLSAIAAMPRTYVRLANDAPAAFEEGEFVRSLRRGAAVGSTGPWIEAALEGAGPGGRFAGSQGTLRVAVRAASWVPVSQLRVFVNGELEHARTVSAPADLELPIQVERDAFVTIEVEGRADALYQAVLPGFTPFAFINPIFVDADANGSWTPPGLPR